MNPLKYLLGVSFAANVVLGVAVARQQRRERERMLAEIAAIREERVAIAEAEAAMEHANRVLAESAKSRAESAQWRKEAEQRRHDAELHAISFDDQLDAWMEEKFPNGKQ